MSIKGEPFSRNMHRKINKIEHLLENNELYDSLRDWFQAAQNYEFVEGEKVEHQDSYWTVENRKTSLIGKKYELRNNKGQKTRAYEGELR